MKLVCAIFTLYQNIFCYFYQASEEGKSDNDNDFNISILSHLLQQNNFRQRLFLVTLFRARSFQPQLTLRQLIQPDLESRYLVTSQLGPSIQSGSSPSAGLQVVTQSTHLSSDSYPQQVSNPRQSGIGPPKQLDYRCMSLHPANRMKIFSKQNEIFQIRIFFTSSQLFFMNLSSPKNTPAKAYQLTKKGL